jgi:hypothetical protein
LLPSLFLLLAAACAKQDAPPADAAPAAESTESATAETAATEAAPASEPEARDSAALDPGAIELTMPRVERWLAATAKIAGLIEKDPALEDVTAMDASESMETYVARLEAHPGVAAAIGSAGETPRDYAMTSAAVTAAMFAQGMLEAGAIKQLPEGMNQQHVDFIREHKDEIAAKMKALEPA